jgi:hypothetical protein
METSTRPGQIGAGLLAGHLLFWLAPTGLAVFGVLLAGGAVATSWRTRTNLETVVALAAAGSGIAMMLTMAEVRMF